MGMPVFFAGVPDNTGNQDNAAPARKGPAVPVCAVPGGVPAFEDAGDTPEDTAPDAARDNSRDNMSAPDLFFFCSLPSSLIPVPL